MSSSDQSLDPGTSADEARTTRERRNRRWLWWLYDLFALAMIGYFIESQLAGNAIWPITVIAYVTVIVFPFAFVMLPIAIWKRHWFGATLQVICAIAYIWVMADALADGHDAEAPAGSIEVGTLTYNLGDGMAEPNDVVDLIRSSDADLVALVEVTDDVATAIETQLADRYPYRVVRGGGIPGKALLSAYPITQFEWLEYNPGRPDLRAEIDLDGRPVSVIVAHPPPPEITATGIRDRKGTNDQIDALMRLVEATDQPLLMLGDFNITRQHDLYEEIEATGLTDVFNRAGNGLGFTMPVRLQALKVISDRLASIRIIPLARIDYIWVSQDWLPLESWVGDDAGSDHMPVLARLALIA